MKCSLIRWLVVGMVGLAVLFGGPVAGQLAAAPGYQMAGDPGHGGGGGG